MTGTKRRQGVNLTLAMFAASLAACAATRSEPPPLPLSGTHWMAQLDTVPGQATLPYLQFANGVVSGSGGCNRLSGGYQLDSMGAGAIVFTRLAGTKMLCSPEIQAGETRMLLVLTGATSYLIKSNELVITGSNGSLKFLGPEPVPK
jgi:heat shock protein HslJ